MTAKAEDSGFDRIATLAVIGPIQEDHASGLVTPTLHCCGRCRGKLRDNPLITNETLFVFARPDFTALQFGSLEQVEKVHRKEKGANLQTFYYGQTPEVFSPLPQPDADGMLRPEQHEVDDTDWQQTAGIYLMERYVRSLGRHAAEYIDSRHSS